MKERWVYPAVFTTVESGEKNIEKGYYKTEHGEKMMGYRHYFYLIDKFDVEKIRDLSYEELIEYSKEHYPEAIEKGTHSDGEAETYLSLYRMFPKEEIYCFGNSFCDTAERIYSMGQPLFRNEDTQKHFEYYEPFLMGKGGMLEAIECFKEKTLSYYQKLLKVFKGESFEEDSFTYSLEMELKEKIYTWSRKPIFNTNPDSKILTDTWLYEYEIFNLMYLYKTIDWDKKTLLFYGW